MSLAISLCAGAAVGIYDDDQFWYKSARKSFGEVCFMLGRQIE